MSSVVQRARDSLPGRFATNWSELRGGEGAVLIAWQLLFSLFPLVIGLLAIIGLLVRDPSRQTALVDMITSQFPSQAGDLLGFIGETRDLGGIFGIVSIVGLLWSGSSLFSVMATVFDRAYGASDRTFLWQRLTDFSMMAIYAVLLTVSVGASSVTGVLVGISEQVLPFRLPYGAFAIGWAISVIAALLLFLLLYRVVPNVPLSFRHVWAGAALSALLFVGLTQAFPIYLRFLGGGFAAYKALGVFLLLMTWFYFLGMILVAGALLNATLWGYDRKAKRPASEANGSTPSDQRGRARARTRESGASAAISDAEGPLKVVAWAGLTAAVTSLVLIVARGVAGSIWRTLTREEPPG
jgi:membrane protein